MTPHARIYVRTYVHVNVSDVGPVLNFARVSPVVQCSPPCTAVYCLIVQLSKVNMGV